MADISLDDEFAEADEDLFAEEDEYEAFLKGSQQKKEEGIGSAPLRAQKVSSLTPSKQEERCSTQQEPDDFEEDESRREEVLVGGSALRNFTTYQFDEVAHVAALTPEQLELLDSYLNRHTALLKMEISPYLELFEKRERDRKEREAAKANLERTSLAAEPPGEQALVEWSVQQGQQPTSKSCILSGRCNARPGAEAKPGSVYSSAASPQPSSLAPTTPQATPTPGVKHTGVAQSRRNFVTATDSVGSPRSRNCSVTRRERRVTPGALRAIDLDDSRFPVFPPRPPPDAEAESGDDPPRAPPSSRRQGATEASAGSMRPSARAKQASQKRPEAREAAGEVVEQPQEQPQEQPHGQSHGQSHDQSSDQSSHLAPASAPPAASSPADAPTTDARTDPPASAPVAAAPAGDPGTTPRLSKGDAQRASGRRSRPAWDVRRAKGDQLQVCPRSGRVVGA